MGDSVNSPGAVFLTKIATSILAADAANVDFQNIPAGFRHLMVVGNMRAATPGASLGMRFNNDSGANYNWGNVFSSASSAGGAQNNSQTSVAVAFFGTSPGANEAASFTAFIIDYTNPNLNKNYNSSAYYAASGGISQYAGRWASTAVINRVTLLMPSGNISANSTFDLYGF